MNFSGPLRGRHAWFAAPIALSAIAAVVALGTLARGGAPDEAAGSGPIATHQVAASSIPAPLAATEAPGSAPRVASAPAPDGAGARTARAGTSTTEPCFEASIADDWLPRATSVELGVDGAAVDALIRGARAAESDALLVVKDGRVLVERTFGRPRGLIETLSMTKSLAALAVLALVADGKIASLDAPLSTWLSDFASGEKASITLRHVLTHTSGLAHGSDADALGAAPDRAAYARSRRVVSTPGSRFSYSNEATQLLALIIEAASGVPADALVKERFFTPLGITDHDWARDRSGKPQTYYGARLHARDLATIGLLLLDGGRWRSRELLPPDLVASLSRSSAQNPHYGLLFWLRYEGSRTAMGNLEPPVGPQIGYFAIGGLGQRLAIYPEARLVAVRQHRRRSRDPAYEKKVTWNDFFGRLEPLVRQPVEPGPTASARPTP